MKSLRDRLCSVFFALIIALPALLPMVGTGTLSTPQYVPMQPGDFNLYRADHFDIYYDSTRISDISDVVIASDAAYDNMTAFFGPFDSRVRIILAANHLQYEDILGGNSLTDSDVASDWGDEARGTIVIEVPDQVPAFGTVLTSELTKVVMRSRLIGYKYDMPEWFSDGVASYVSRDVSDSSRAAIEQASRDNKLMSIAQMESILDGSAGANVSSSDADMARAQAGMLMEYTIQKFGNDDIRLIMQDFGTTGNLDKAISGRIGYTADDLNEDWEAALARSLADEARQAIAQRAYGYVFGPDGKPVANLTLLFTSQSNDSSLLGKTYKVTTDSDGHYAVNMTYGPFDIRADRQGYTLANGNVTLQKNEVKLYNLTMIKAGQATPSRGLSANAGGDDGIAYAILGVMNVAALLLVAFVFLRIHK